MIRDHGKRKNEDLQILYPKVVCGLLDRDRNPLVLNQIPGTDYCICPSIYFRLPARPLRLLGRLEGRGQFFATFSFLASNSWMSLITAEPISL